MSGGSVSSSETPSGEAAAAVTERVNRAEEARHVFPLSEGLIRETGLLPVEEERARARVGFDDEDEHRGV